MAAGDLEWFGRISSAAEFRAGFFGIRTFFFSRFRPKRLNSVEPVAQMGLFDRPNGH